MTDRRRDLVVHRDDPDDSPDFILLNRATNQQTWIEIVEAVESGGLIAAERRAERLYNAAAREYRVRGEEVVLTVSRHGVEDVTPSPGFGVTGLISPGSPRKITPPEWIARARDRKGRATRYGPTERARTILVIDCSPEVFIGSEDAADVRVDLEGNTLGCCPGVFSLPHRMNAVMEKRLPNNAEERAAGSRSLAAAAHRGVSQQHRCGARLHVLDGGHGQGQEDRATGSGALP